MLTIFVALILFKVEICFSEKSVTSTIYYCLNVSKWRGKNQGNKGGGPGDLIFAMSHSSESPLVLTKGRSCLFYKYEINMFNAYWSGS